MGFEAFRLQAFVRSALRGQRSRSSLRQGLVKAARDKGTQAHRATRLVHSSSFFSWKRSGSSSSTHQTVNTLSPAARPPRSRSPCTAVIPARGVVAACSKLTPAGLRARTSSRVETYSAKAPWPTKPNTSLPGRKRVTSFPTASTCPATSPPAPRSLVAPPCLRSRDVRKSPHEAPVPRIGRGRSHPHEYLMASTVGSSISLRSRTSGGPNSS